MWSRPRKPFWTESRGAPTKFSVLKDVNHRLVQHR
jgi:hypothetical protein